MSVDGKFEDITRSDLLAVAASNNIKDASEVIDQVVDTVADWPQTARNCGVPEAMISDIKKNMKIID